MIKTTFTASISALVAFTSIESSNAYPLSEAGHVPEYHVTEPTHDTAAVSADPPTHPDLVYKSYEPDLERDHVKLVLTNDSNQKVEVYWHDYHGTKQYYYTLNPGASVTQETYVHHPWSVVGLTNSDAPLTVDGFGVFIPVSADNGRTVSIAETTFNHSNPCADGCNVMPPQQTYYGATGTEYFNGNWVTAYSHNSFKEVNYTGECKENAFDYFDDGCLVNNKVVDETKCWKERDFYCFETRFNDESKTI